MSAKKRSGPTKRKADGFSDIGVSRLHDHPSLSKHSRETPYASFLQDYREQVPLHRDKPQDLATPSVQPRLRGVLGAIYEAKAVVNLTPEQHSARLELLAKYCSNRGIEFLRRMYLDNDSTPANRREAVSAPSKGNASRKSNP